MKTQGCSLTYQERDLQELFWKWVDHMMQLLQVYIGGKWVGLDAAFKSAGFGGFDPGHITLAEGNGNPEDFLNLINTLGLFKVDKVVVLR